MFKIFEHIPYSPFTDYEDEDHLISDASTHLEDQLKSFSCCLVGIKLGIILVL